MVRFRPLALASLAIGLLPSALPAQQAFDPLNTREIDMARGALLSSVPVQQSLGATPHYAFVTVERHLEAKGAESAARRADVILFNYRTNETVSAVVNLAGAPRVDAFRVTRDLPPPLGAEEVETAKQLALANAGVRTRLQSAGLADADPALIVTHLFGRAEDATDACATNRCVLLFFNTRTAFLFGAAVDLTDSRVRTIVAPER